MNLKVKELIIFLELLQFYYLTNKNTFKVLKIDNMSKITPSLQDFSLINTSVAKIKEDLEFDTPSNAFYFFVMDYILELNEDEIRDSITDTHFLKSSN